MDNLLKLIFTLGKNLGNDISIRQLAIEAGVPYTTTYRLVKLNAFLFRINQKGAMKLCSLDTDNKITKNYLIIAERFQAELMRKKDPRFKVLQQELPEDDYSLVLFGSRADGTHRDESDIDLCIINETGKPNVSFSKFELIFNLEINQIVFMQTEFISMLRDKEHNVAKEIIKKHIILYGEEDFWNLVWKHGV